MFQLEPGVVIWTIINFLLLLVVLRLFAWKPILDALEKREGRIRSSLEQADAAQQEAERRLKEYAALIENSKKEALDLIEKGRERAETTRQEILARAHQETEAILTHSKREITLEREKAIEEIRKEAIKLSVEIAGKILSRRLTEDDQKLLIEDATKELYGKS